MKKKTWLKLTFILVFMIGLVALNQFVFEVTPSSLRDWVLSFGIIAPIVYMMLNVIRPLTLFPISVFSLAGGLAFGVLWGTVYTVISATAGALLSFYIAKHLGKRWLKNRTESPGRIANWQKKMRKKGLFYIILLRVIPILNFDLVSYVAGVSGVKLRSYLLATVIGLLPGTIAANLVGYSFIEGNGTIIMIVVGIGLLMCCVPVVINNKQALPELFHRHKEDNV